jgi:ABC-type Fe3+-hydroxamate transport system substrate-binding protein
VSLDPELVILFAGESDSTTPARLRELGIPCLAIRPEGLAEIRTVIAQLGSLAEQDAAADSLLAAMDSTLTEIGRRVRGRPRVRVAYVLGGTPPWVAGGDSYLDEMLTAAGGENVFADLGVPYGPVSPEQLVARRVDLLLAPEGGDVRLPGVEIRLRRVPAALEIPGPQVARWVSELAEILHPEAIR